MARVMSSGVTEIEVMVGAVTFTEVDPVTEPSVAVIVADPAAIPLTKPLALTVALAIVDEDHVTRSVMSHVLASLFVPVATICCVVFTGTVGLAGSTAIDTGVAHTFALVTVICVEAEKFPDCAVTVGTPVTPPVTTPAALTDAVVVSAELHVTEAVKSFVLPSEKLPVACRDCVLLTITVAAGGVTARPVSDTEPPCPPPPPFPPPPPLAWFLRPLQPASITANERTQILRRTVFPSARMNRANALSLVIRSQPETTGGEDAPVSNKRQSGSRFYLLWEISNAWANGLEVLAFQCDTF